MPETVLDVGCGIGNSTQVLADTFPAAHIIGADNSPDMLRYARENASAFRMWEIMYFFEMPSHESILEWYRGAKVNQHKNREHRRKSVLSFAFCAFLQQFAFDGNRVHAPWNHLAAVLEGGLDRVLQTAAARHLHAHDGDAADVVAREDSVSFSL